jgi:hypothetical protein
MKKKTINKKGVSAKKIIGIGMGVAALTAAAYVLFGPEGKKNRKMIRSWGVKMKAEIIEKFEKTKEITEPIYHQIIDNAQAKYAKIKNVDQNELALMVAELKKHWKDLAKNKKVAKKSTPKKTTLNKKIKK